MPVLDRLARTGLRRGLLEGSRGWLWVGIAAAGWKIARRVVSPPPETVYRQVLKPGEGLEIRTRRPG